MEFKKGTKVTVLDEDLSGTLINSEDNWVEFLSEDGFTYRYPKEAVCVVRKDHEVEFTPATINAELKEVDQKGIRKGIRPINFNKTKTAFDLHLEALFPDRIPSKDDISLQIQLEYATQVLNKAISLRVRQLVFIHGMGQGVLRDELRRMLDRDFPNAEYFDANYQKYGQGATEVIIHGLGSI